MRIVTAAIAAIMAFLTAGFAAESPDCAVASHLAGTEYPLPRVAAAIAQTRQLVIVVMGAGSSTLTGPGGSDLAYPARLQAILSNRWPGVNTKVVTNVKSRRAAAEMEESFEKILMEEKPALVIWQSGTVDAITGVDPEDFRATLDDGVEALHAGGADVILMNMQYSPRTESMIAIQAYADMMRQISLQREVPLLDRLALMRHWNETGTFDLHAATGKLDVAARIHDCLGQLLADLIYTGAKLTREQTKAIQ
jgi:GDSL-like Lipase/Acylhydrolase family